MKRARLFLLPLAAASLLAGVQPAAAGPYVTSRWTQYSGPVQPCLYAARLVLETRRLQIDRFGPSQVIGEAGGITVAVRCDAPGYAFAYFAFTDGAPSAVREQLADEVREELRRGLAGGGGRY